MRKRGTIPIAAGNLLGLSIPLLLVFKDKTKASTSTHKNGIIDQERNAGSWSSKRTERLTAHHRKRSIPVVADLDNGGRAEYRRLGTQLTTIYFSASGEVTCELFYKLSDRGRPLNCEIHDESGEKAYKTSFGYSKRPGPTFGKLVQELRFDARKKQFYEELNPDGTRKEKPVHMIVHSYGEDETPKLPVVMNLMEKPDLEAFLSPIEGGLGKLPPEIIDKLNHAHPEEKPIEP